MEIKKEITLKGNADEDPGVIVNYLDHRFQGNNNDFWEPEVGRYHSSYMGKCLRKLFLKYELGKRKDKSSLPHFEIGNKVEEIVERALKYRYGWQFVKNSYRIRLEVDENDFQVVGETDPVLVAENGEVDRLFECKSTKDLYYVMGAPQKDHILQVHPYMRALGLDECTFIYVQKTDYAEKWHTIQFDEEILEYGLDRLRKLHDALTEGYWPEAEPFLEEFECENCKYSEECGEGLV